MRPEFQLKFNLCPLPLSKTSVVIYKRNARNLHWESLQEPKKNAIICSNQYCLTSTRKKIAIMQIRHLKYYCWSHKIHLISPQKNKSGTCQLSILLKAEASSSAEGTVQAPLTRLGRSMTFSGVDHHSPEGKWSSSAASLHIQKHPTATI